jgi:hypothetical protein
MRIVQPIMEYNGGTGWIVYAPNGKAMAFIQGRDPMPTLHAIIGPHVMLGLVATVTTTQYRRWAHQMPGSEALPC